MIHHIWLYTFFKTYKTTLYIIDVSNRKDTHQIYDGIGFESRKEGLWNWEGEQWKVNFIRMLYFFYLKKSPEANRSKC